MCAPPSELLIAFFVLRSELSRFEGSSEGAGGSSREQEGTRRNEWMGFESLLLLFSAAESHLNHAHVGSSPTPGQGCDERFAGASQRMQGPMFKRRFRGARVQIEIILLEERRSCRGQ